MRREWVPVCLLLALAIALYVLFMAFPQLDFAPSQFFYDSAAGQFSPRLHPLGMLVKHALYDFNDVWIPLLLIGNALFFIQRGRTQWLGLRRAHWAFLAVFLALGPGLTVSLAKDYFHRPRPVEIVQFGGTQDYVAPFHRGQGHGQSFFSGHVSNGFYFCAFGLLAATHRRRRYLLGAGVGAAIGIARLMVGGHFLSDILFAAVITLLIMHLLTATLFRRALATS